MGPQGSVICTLGCWSQWRWEGWVPAGDSVHRLKGCRMVGGQLTWSAGIPVPQPSLYASKGSGGRCEQVGPEKTRAVQ